MYTAQTAKTLLQQGSIPDKVYVAALHERKMVEDSIKKIEKFQAKLDKSNRLDGWVESRIEVETKTLNKQCRNYLKKIAKLGGKYAGK